MFGLTKVLCKGHFSFIKDKELNLTIKEIEIQLALGSLSYGMKYELSNNTNTPKKILTILSKDKSWVVRNYVAENPNTPIKILIKLSFDENWNVRYWVANNPNTPIKILTILSKDEDNHISRAAIQNKYRNKR